MRLPFLPAPHTPRLPLRAGLRPTQASILEAGSRGTPWAAGRVSRGERGGGPRVRCKGDPAGSGRRGWNPARLQGCAPGRLSPAPSYSRLLRAPPPILEDPRPFSRPWLGGVSWASLCQPGSPSPRGAAGREPEHPDPGSVPLSFHRLHPFHSSSARVRWGPPGVPPPQPQRPGNFFRGAGISLFPPGPRRGLHGGFASTFPISARRLVGIQPFPGPSCMFVGFGFGCDPG